MTGAKVRTPAPAPAQTKKGINPPKAADKKARKASKSRPTKLSREAQALAESNFKNRTEDVQNASPEKKASPRKAVSAPPPKTTYGEHSYKQQELVQQIAPVGAEPVPKAGVSKKRPTAADTRSGEGGSRSKRQKRTGSSEGQQETKKSAPAEAGPSTGYDGTSAVLGNVHTGKAPNPATEGAPAEVPIDKRTNDASKEEGNGKAQLGARLVKKRTGAVDPTVQCNASDAAAAPADCVFSSTQGGTSDGSQAVVLNPASKKSEQVSLANPARQESNGGSLKEAQGIVPKAAATAVHSDSGGQQPLVAPEAPMGRTTQTGCMSSDGQGHDGAVGAPVRHAVAEAEVPKHGVTNGEEPGPLPADRDGTCIADPKAGNPATVDQRPGGKQRVAHGKRSTVMDAAGGAGLPSKKSKAGKVTSHQTGAARPKDAPKDGGAVDGEAAKHDQSGARPDGEAVALPAAAPATAAAAMPPPQQPGGVPPLNFPVLRLPCLDSIGDSEKEGIISLQRELSDLRSRYRQLKDVKLREMEGILAEQVEYAEEKVRCAEGKVHAYKADAEAAERRAEEAVKRMSELEAEKTAWLKERFEHLRDRIRLEQELGQVQRENHDLRAEIHRLKRGASTLDATDNGVTPPKRGHDEVAVPAGGAVNQQGAVEAELLPNRMSSRGNPAEASPGAGGDDKQEPSLADNGAHMGLTTSPEGTGCTRIPFKGLLGNGNDDTSPALPSTKTGLSTACLKIVRMLPSLGSLDKDDAPHPIAVAPELFEADKQVNPDVTLSGLSASGAHPGVSKECLLVVQMLPSLRVPVSSGGVVQGPEPVDTATTPHVDAPVQGQSASLAHGSRDRHSEGSPIDGICRSDQRKAGAKDSSISFTFAPVAATPGDETVQGQAPPDAPSKTPLSARAQTTVNATALVDRSGAMSSNQGSCNVPLLICRAQHQQQQDAGVHGRITPQAQGRPAVSPAPTSARTPLAQSPLGVTPGAETCATAAQGHPAGVVGAQYDPSFQHNAPRSPSPRTTRLMLYEMMSGWQVHVISAKPSHTRFTSTLYGMSYELQEADEADEDFKDDNEEGTPGRKKDVKFFVYTPLDLGSLRPYLPNYFQEPMGFDESHMHGFMDLINEAIVKVQTSRQSESQRHAADAST